MTSLPMLYAKMLGYCIMSSQIVTIDRARLTPRKASIVVMYSLRRLVDQEGDARSIDPLRGRDMSSLFICQSHSQATLDSGDLSRQTHMT